MIGQETYNTESDKLMLIQLNTLKLQKVTKSYKKQITHCQGNVLLWEVLMGECNTCPLLLCLQRYDKDMWYISIWHIFSQTMTANLWLAKLFQTIQNFLMPAGEKSLSVAGLIFNITLTKAKVLTYWQLNLKCVNLSITSTCVMLVRSILLLYHLM